MIFVTPTIYKHPEDITWDKMLNTSSESMKSPEDPESDKKQKRRGKG